MSGNLYIKNANGNTLTISNPDTVTEDVTITSEEISDSYLGKLPTSWDEGYTYSENDIQPYGGILYKSLQSANLNHTPVTDGSEDLWWEAVEFGSAGLSNYIADKFSDWDDTDSTIDLAYNTTTPLKEDGDIKITFTSSADGDGTWQDITLNETDLNSLLQLKLYLKPNSVSAVDLGELDIVVSDQTEATVYGEWTIEDNVEYNSASGVYLFSQLFASTDEAALRVKIEANTGSVTGALQVVDVSLSAPFYYTAPSTGALVGEIAEFATYKDRSSDGFLPFAFDNAVSVSDYP